jgi:hypothetical protein
MTPNNILRYLEHGYVMKLEDQIETAEYIRNLQKSNKVLLEGMIELADTIFRLRQLQESRNKNERTA